MGRVLEPSSEYSTTHIKQLNAILPNYMWSQVLGEGLEDIGGTRVLSVLVRNYHPCWGLPFQCDCSVTVLTLSHHSIGKPNKFIGSHM